MKAVDAVSNEEDRLVHSDLPVETLSRTVAIGDPSGRVGCARVRLKLLHPPDRLEIDVDGHSDCLSCLLTDDGSSIAPDLADGLRHLGWKVTVLSLPYLSGVDRQELFRQCGRLRLDDWNEEKIEETLASAVQTPGPFSAFVHLHPERTRFPADETDPDELDYRILRSVFFLAKHLSPQLNGPAGRGHGRFFTVVRLDGAFGVGCIGNDSSESRLSPSAGGVENVIAGGFFGLAKTLALEWDKVFCRALDLSPEIEEKIAVEKILAEWQDPDRSVVEVAHGSFGRTTLAVQERLAHDKFETDSVVSAGPASRTPGPDSVFLVSGGARGITARCVMGLAHHMKCRFVLLGRSQRGPEPEYAKGITDISLLKRRIMDAINDEGKKPTPAGVQERLRAILANREIEQTIEAVKAAGGDAVYLSADVTDPVGLREKLSLGPEGQTSFGLPITGIIHGAGKLADRLIENKTRQDFEAVYSTKVDGLLSMLECVEANGLETLVFFSSAAGFFGNAGQSDYAMANEILNKFAWMYKRMHPFCRVVSFNWGPWDGGMVTAEIIRVLADRGIELIPMELGALIFVDELARRDRDDVQVVVGGRGPVASRFYKVEPTSDTHSIHRTLSLETSPILRDHVIGGHEVVPVTCALVWMANVCQSLYPGYHFFSFQDLRILKGIVFDEAASGAFTLDLKRTGESGDGNAIDLEAMIRSETAQELTRYHFAARLKLLRLVPAAPFYENRDFTCDDSLRLMRPYLDGTLFQGPLFEGVKRILNISPERLTAECVAPQVPESQWGQFPPLAFNPVAADIHLQCMAIWARYFHQAGGLPLCARGGEQFRCIPAGRMFYVTVEVKSCSSLTLVADVISHDRDGRVYSRLLGAELTISSRLNPLIVPARGDIAAESARG